MDSGLRYTTPQPLSPDSQDVNSKTWVSEAFSIEVPELTNWPRGGCYRQSLLVGKGFPDRREVGTVLVRGDIGFLFEQG